jgi:protein TonB
MELKKIASSVSDEKRSSYILIVCYLLFVCILYIYKLAIIEIRSSQSKETYQMVYQSASLDPLDEKNSIYSPPPPPAETQDILEVPTVVDTIAEIEKDTIVKEEPEKNLDSIYSSENEYSDEGNGNTGDGNSGYGESGGTFFIAEKMPSFPGGDLAMRKFIADNVVYPPEANKKKVQGNVYVQFCVMFNGTIEMVSIVKGVNPLLDNEAKRVVQSMPLWIPGEQRGRKVNVWFTVSINFQLN